MVGIKEGTYYMEPGESIIKSMFSVSVVALEKCFEQHETQVSSLQYSDNNNNNHQLHWIIKKKHLSAPNTVPIDSK